MGGVAGSIGRPQSQPTSFLVAELRGLSGVHAHPPMPCAQKRSPSQYKVQGIRSSWPSTVMSDSQLLSIQSRADGYQCYFSFTIHISRTLGQSCVQIESPGVSSRMWLLSVRWLWHPACPLPWKHLLHNHLQEESMYRNDQLNNFMCAKYVFIVLVLYSHVFFFFLIT